MRTHTFINQLDPDGCRELPFVQDATQVVYDYINGSTGYIAFVIAAVVLAVGLVSRKQLTKAPGWLAAVVGVVLFLGALVTVLPAIGVNLGCGSSGAGGGIGNQPTITVPAPEEN